MLVWPILADVNIRERLSLLATPGASLLFSAVEFENRTYGCGLYSRQYLGRFYYVVNGPFILLTSHWVFT